MLESRLALTMDAPPVQYITTPDGVSIAYAVVGSGFPLVLADSFTTAGIDIRFRSSRSADFHEALSAGHKVIAFDWRNSGLSGAAERFSLAKYVNDIEELVSHLDLQRFDLWATLGPCKVALEFAALHQPNVRKLVLSHPTPRGSSPRTYYGEPILHLLSTDWPAFTELFALRIYGWTESGRDFMEQLRRNWTQETFSSFMSAMEDYNPSASSSTLRCETLVIADAAGRSVDVQEARRLAADIPKGHLMLTDLGGSLANAYHPELARIGHDFLGDDEAEEERRPGNTEPASNGTSENLSLREVEVLRLLASGKSNQEIADELVISLNTVRRHVSNVFDKTGVSNRTQAAAYARDHSVV
jgi:DNA-binding NarL/FixJ family response regulator